MRASTADTAANFPDFLFPGIPTDPLVYSHVRLIHLYSRHPSDFPPLFTISIHYGACTFYVSNIECIKNVRISRSCTRSQPYSKRLHSSFYFAFRRL